MNKIYYLEQYIKQLLELYMPSVEINNKKDYKIHNKITAKFWELDTSIFAILKKFFERCNNIVSKDKLSYLTVVKSNELNKNNNPEFGLVSNLNDFLTPSRNNSHYKSLAAIRQYIQVLWYFELIILPNGVNKITTLFNSNNKISFNLEILNFVSVEKFSDWLSLDKLIEFVVHGFKRKLDSFIDLSFSYFLAVLAYYYKEYEKDFLFIEHIFLNDIHHIDSKVNKKITENIKSEKLNIINLLNEKNISLNISEDSRKHNLPPIYTLLVSYYGGTTYRDLVDTTVSYLKEISDNPVEQLYFFISKIIDSLAMDGIVNIDVKQFVTNQLIRDEKALNKELIDELRQEEQHRQTINQERAKLRKNIIESRINKWNRQDCSNDIIPVNPNDKYVYDNLKQQEAAHIFDVWRFEKYDENNLEDLSNPNNGIMIDHVYHDALDSGLLQLSVDGYLIPNKEWKDYYCNNQNYTKYPDMKINKDVVDFNSMTEFIKKRALIPGTKHKN